MSDAKKKILARRAQFIAAAIAGLGVDACHKEHAEKPEAGDTAQTPQPCLSVYYPPPEPPEAGGPAIEANATPDAGIGPPPAPHPCLRMAAPPKTK